MPTVNELTPGTELDFLPERYRENNAQRKIWTWRLAIVGLLATLLPVASLVQLRMRRSIEAEIAALTQSYSSTEQDTLRLGRVEAELQQAESVARLLTYLRYPWPRSQVLSALLPALPDSVTLTSIQLDEAGATTIAATTAQNPHQENRPEAQSLRPAEQDLKTLREQHDTARVELIITGIATDPAQLHAYLEALSRERLFIKAELLSLESFLPPGPRTTDVAKDVRFRARLVLTQGYGQPKGPRPPGGDVATTHVLPSIAGDRP